MKTKLEMNRSKRLVLVPCPNARCCERFCVSVFLRKHPFRSCWLRIAHVWDDACIRGAVGAMRRTRVTHRLPFALNSKQERQVHGRLLLLGVRIGPGCV